MEEDRDKRESESTAMKLPPEQEAIRAKCFHPAGKFVEFPEENVDLPISKHFERVAKQWPGRLAIKIGDCALTYAELNRQANRVAHVILEKCGDKIGPIMVLADQRPETLASLLGVLKAGKIMIAVDPLLPVDRLRAIADDSRAEAILTFGDDLQRATGLTGAGRPMIEVEACRSDTFTDNIAIARSPLDPARIRYTSGSTGKPKGVLSNHRKDTFHCITRINRGHICQEDRLVVLRRFSFSFTDIFCGLLVGASVFPFDIKAQGLQSLEKFLCAEEITYFVATPSIFRYFAQRFTGGEDFPHLRMIKLGGEPLFRTDVELYKKHFSPECILLNQLSGSEMGPVCQYWIGKATEVNTTIVPVGYPVEGKKIVLLDEERKEVGANDVGEIAVASSYLFSGYWNQAAHTNNKVLSGDDRTDEKLYLTGDLGRMLPGGCLLYVGRKDDQVKIRGVKVEIREVEAVLSEHPQVKQAAVVALDGSGGDKYLTAYIVPFDPAGITVTAINNYLRQRIPDYMIPSACVFLSELPVMNGKVDRRALPRPDDKRPELNTPYTSPGNEIEKSLVRIWEEVLNIHPVGVRDNFFDLGGHSLAATQVVSRVIHHFKLEVPLQSMFESPTIGDMAAVIAAHQGKTLDDRGLTALLKELETMSDAEAKRILDDQHHEHSKK